MRGHPAPLRRAAVLLACAWLFFSAIPGQAQTAGVLDQIALSYRSTAAGWTSTLLGYANRLFMLLATIELAWSFAVWTLEKNEYQSLIAAVAKKIMGIGIFYALLLNGPTWIPAIIDSFSEAGSAASGSAGLSPSEVFTTGLDNAATLLDGVKNLSLLDDFAAIVIAGLSAILIILSFAVIAGQLLVALIESYIAVSAGLLFLGFGGSRWTTDFVQKFIGYAMATGIKLFMLFLIIGIGNAQAVGWRAMLAAIGEPGAAVFNLILTVLGGSVLLAFIAMQIPAMAASMLAGSPTLTGGGAAAATGTVGAGLVASSAAGAATTLGAAKSLAGMAEATRAAYGEAGVQGTTGLARAVATLGNLGTAAMQDSGQRLAEAIAPTKGGRMADISSARSAEQAAAAPTTALPVSAPDGKTTDHGTAATTAPSADHPPGASATPATERTAPGTGSQLAAAGMSPRPAAAGQASGLEQHLRALQQVRPPQLPSDAAPPATVHIRFDASD